MGRARRKRQGRPVSHPPSAPTSLPPMSRTPQSPFPCAPSGCHAARPDDHGESGSFGLVTTDYDTFPTQRDDARAIALAAYRSIVPRYLSREWFPPANDPAPARTLDAVDLV